MTLQEGIKRFNKKNAHLTGDNMSEEVRQFFRCHDAAHVIFGCNTSMFGEGIVKTWTLFGSDLGLLAMLKGYRAASAFELAKKYSWRHVCKNIFRLIATMPKVAIRAHRMNKAWPWHNFDKYLDQELDVIREEFGIVPIKTSQK